MSSVVLGIIAETFVNLNAIERRTQEWRQPHASMAWNRHATRRRCLNTSVDGVGRPTFDFHTAHNRSKFRIFCRFMSAIARFSAHGNRINRNDCLNNCRS